jgi:hypothetical protein
LFACEQVIDLELPPHEPSIVLNAYLIAGDTFPDIGSWNARNTFVSVSGSKATLTPGNVQDITDASVRLYADGSRVASVNRGVAFAENWDWTDPWDPNRVSDSVYHYPITHELQGGVTYKLEAEREGFKNPVVWAEQTMPTKPVIENITRSGGNNSTTIEFDLVDSPTPGERYIIRLMVQYDNSSPYYEEWFSCLNPNFSSLSFMDEFDEIGEGLNETYQGIIRDDNMNGSRQRIALRVASWSSDQATSYAVEITSVTPDFERYLRSFYLNEIAGFNPFSEPSQVFYNVRNGYGVVLAGHRTFGYTN